MITSDPWVLPISGLSCPIALLRVCRSQLANTDSLRRQRRRAAVRSGIESVDDVLGIGVHPVLVQVESHDQDGSMEIKKREGYF